MIRYTEEEFLNAYYAWANKSGGTSGRDRINEWCRYCDIRDGVKLGSNLNRYNKINRDISPVDALEAANKVARHAFIDQIVSEQ